MNSYIIAFYFTARALKTFIYFSIYYYIIYLMLSLFLLANIKFHILEILIPQFPRALAGAIIAPTIIGPDLISSDAFSAEMIIYASFHRTGRAFKYFS